MDYQILNAYMTASGAGNTLWTVYATVCAFIVGLVVERAEKLSARHRCFLALAFALFAALNFFPIRKSHLLADDLADAFMAGETLGITVEAFPAVVVLGTHLTIDILMLIFIVFWPFGTPIRR